MGAVRQNPIQRTVSLFICVCIALCTIVAHNIAQNRPDSFPPYPPDNHHCSDDVYLREGGGIPLGDTLCGYRTVISVSSVLAVLATTNSVSQGSVRDNTSHNRANRDCGLCSVICRRSPAPGGLPSPRPRDPETCIRPCFSPTAYQIVPLRGRGGATTTSRLILLTVIVSAACGRITTAS